MKLSEFDYQLPESAIAQEPLAERDASRLLLGRGADEWEDRRFRELPELVRGHELMVLNNAKVFPARLFGRRRGVGATPAGRAQREHLKAAIEALLVRRLEGTPGEEVWEALVRPGRKVGKGEALVFGEGELEAEVVARGEYGLRTLRFHWAGDFRETVNRLGHVPLPPYIRRPDRPGDGERYQTVFARREGAVAAPTAGLHFTPEILAALRQRGCEVAEITLEVGYGTFQPIHTETVERHKMHSERYEVSDEAAAAVERARAAGRPVLAVGTTVVRALEDCARRRGKVEAGRYETDLFIYPGYEFKVVDQLLTNFHLPRSSLLLLVCAFAGRERVLAAYEHAVRAGYRFYSYGDCMLIR
ncbi:MAG: tRNA preQ1(34) S-adenosylmethionine ribosyltransferase-isomerase QueA [Candidatus Acidiferrales bacterium]